MSEFLVEGLVDGQRVVMTKNVEGTVQANNAYSTEVLVEVSDGVYQRCIAVNNVGGGGGGASALSDLTDVNFTDLQDGQIIVYDLSSGKWVNQTPASYDGDTQTITI